MDISTENQIRLIKEISNMIYSMKKIKSDLAMLV